MNKSVHKNLHKARRLLKQIFTELGDVYGSHNVFYNTVHR